MRTLNVVTEEIYVKWHSAIEYYVLVFDRTCFKQEQGGKGRRLRRAESEGNNAENFEGV